MSSPYKVPRRRWTRGLGRALLGAGLGLAAAGAPPTAHGPIPAAAEVPLDRWLPVALAETAPPIDPLDPIWDAVPATPIQLYPQATAPDGPGGAVLALEARLRWGDGQLALRLTWPDPTEDLVDPHATHRFADAAAVQFAPGGETLPYVGMGEPGRPVAIWRWHAGGTAEGLSAQGFGSLMKHPGPQPESRALRIGTGWVLVLRGAVGPEIAAVALAAWDGVEDGRAGRKRLSAWQRIDLPGAESRGRLAAEAKTAGDPARGGQLFARHGCGACHGPEDGPGPQLAHAGRIHWPGYLRRSIAAPESFRVPGFTAVMPVLPLNPGEIDDLAAYLMTLR